MSRRIAAAALIAALAAGAAAAREQVRIVGNMALHFSQRPTAGEAIDAFATPDQPFFYGPGWEVLLDHVGIGGNYMVRFFKDDLDQWWVDWVSEGLFLSYHLVGAGHLVDPYVHLAVGTAGRALAEREGCDNDPVSLSLFPMLAAGLAFDLDGFLIGGRLSYIPEVGPPPGTDIASYPVERFQVALYGGVALGGHHERERPRHRRSLHVHWD